MPHMTIGNSELFYRDQGAGPALVLVHGFPLDGSIWDEQLAELSKDQRVIVPDLPGFGQSKSRAPFTLKSMGDDLHQLLGKLGALPCILGGLSMGGYVAQAYIKKHPADLSGLVLVDTKAEGDSTEAKGNRQKMAELARTQGSKAVAEQMLPKMLHSSAYASRPDVVARTRKIMENCPAQTIANACIAMRDRDDHTADLASIAVPTLLIYGEGDAITPPSVGEFIRSQVPHAKLVVISGAGHLSSLERPAEVTQALREFLAS